MNFRIRLATMVFIFSLFNVFVFSQNLTDSNDDYISPKEERFEKTTGLITPWRETGCHHLDTIPYIINIKPADLPKCNEVLKKYKDSHMLTLYNEDGTVWYNFSIAFTAEREKKFWRNRKKGFHPFAEGSPVSKGPSIHTFIILRLVGKSDNWYKVEINEETQETKYVLKDDPMWTKIGADYWLVSSGKVFLNKDKLMLYDKPNGKVIEKSRDTIHQELRVFKVDGDWIYTETRHKYTGEKISGWIRWQKGRKLLVGSIFNNFNGR